MNSCIAAGEIHSHKQKQSVLSIKNQLPSCCESNKVNKYIDLLYFFSKFEMHNENLVQQKQSLTLISYSVKRKNGERCGESGWSYAGSCDKGLICCKDPSGPFDDHGKCRKNNECKQNNEIK